MSKDLVRKQFGEHAEAYATSRVHAQGASLTRLVELVEPQEDWRILDVATAAGHTAFVFAPHVRHVVASDLTPEMLRVAARGAEERTITNVSFELADAEDLPFDDGEFDLVTCRIAPHHFQHIDRFLSESARVLREGGVLAVVDNVVPDGDAGDYVNRFEQIRDPSHHRALALDEWVTAFTHAGFDVLQTETARKRMDFQPWAERMGASDEVIAELRQMLVAAPDEAAKYFCLDGKGAELTFDLTEAIVVGRRLSNS